MSLRRRFLLSFVTFVVAMMGVSAYLAWWEAERALEAELNEKAAWVARAAVATGLQASSVVGLQPGFEDEIAWTSYHFRLRALLFVVREAYILRSDNTALVTSFSADSIPIGAPLTQFEFEGPRLEEARSVGYAASDGFTGNDGRFYKWGFAALDDSETVLAVLMPADYQEPLIRLRRNLIVGSLAAALLAALLAGLLATSVVRPLERLSRVAIRIQRGRMDEPVAEEGGHEVGRLSRAMERMRLGILARDEQLRLMLAQVAHEIRNPLGGLELFASAAADTEDPTERARLIKRVREEVSALNEIISDFLTFARPIGPSRESNDIRPAIREAVELVDAELKSGGGSIEVDLPAVPLMARVPEDHVKRVALNLLRNAAQASDRVFLKAEVRNGETVLVVSDEGPGVPKDMRERVFDPFVTDKEQGAGLGLAIVKKVAEANGGRVELADPAETDGVGGAEFRVYFGSLEDISEAVTSTD